MNDKTKRTIRQAKQLLAFYYAEGHSPQSLAERLKVNHINLVDHLTNNLLRDLSTADPNRRKEVDYE